MSADNLQEKDMVDGHKKTKKKVLTIIATVVLVTILLLILKPWRVTGNPYFKQFFGVLTGEKLTEVSENEEVAEENEEVAKEIEEKEETKETDTEIAEDDWWKEAIARPAETKGEPEKEIFIPIAPPAHVEERPDTELAPAGFKGDLLKLINDFRAYDETLVVSMDANLEAQAQQKSNEAAIRGAILSNYIKGVSSITFLGLVGDGVESFVVQENLNQSAYETYMNPRWKKIGIGAIVGSFDGNEQIVWAIILAE